MTQSEMERVASLAGHPGFKSLMKLLDEADAGLLTKLEKVGEVDEAATLNLWRASRRLKSLIENVPAQLIDQLGINVFQDFN